MCVCVSERVRACVRLCRWPYAPSGRLVVWVVPCRVALFPLEFFYVTLRFFLGTLSTQSIHRSAPTRLPPDLALSSILPFRRAPSFPLPLRPFFPPFFLQGAEEKPPHDNPPPTSSVHRSRPPPSRHESLSRPIKQTTVKSVPVSVFVCQHQHSAFTIRTSCLACLAWSSPV